MTEINTFFTITDEDAVRHIYDEYPDVLERLKRAYAVRNSRINRPSESLSPSRILFDTEYDEVNRTVVGVLTLRWLWKGEYDKLVGTQEDNVRLAPESFNCLRNLFIQGIKNDEDLQAIITAIMTNDLGKDHQLAVDYAAKTGEDISNSNHDLILLKAVEAGLVPCLSRLQPKHREYIIQGIKLGSVFIFGQMAQAENAPACLSEVAKMRGNDQAFEFRFMEQLLDVAGADGHNDWTCARMLNEPIYQGFQTVKHAALAVIRDNISFRDAYDTVLAAKSALLANRGFRPLTIADTDERALLRLLCMGNVVDIDTAKLYEAAWQSMDRETKEVLIYRLNVDGSVDEPAVQPTYMPALLRSTVAVASDKVETLKGLFGFLARVMDPGETHHRGIAVIERIVLPVLQQVAKASDVTASFFAGESATWLES